MEPAGFNRFYKHAKSTSGLSIIHGGSSNSNNGTNNGKAANSNTMPPPCTVREQDQYMPIANVIRIMRRILPTHAKISDDAKETIQECVSEYISFITGEANERCQREQRKTITAEDVLWAMGKLGFDDYVEPLTVFLNRYRENENERTSVRGEPILKRGIDYGSPIMMAPPYGHQQGILDGATAMGGYLRDGSGGGSTSLINNFDPFGQYNYK
ncbi:NUCLEAR FACTOR Y, SUBUNIT B9, LEAFY COTYLEDON 1, EMBRYO DEFECTIVE 212 [Hibiscus trionum]|uniref:NUCLEAR FACTOR Y, SUBUNIT B9, LEAFY COTYLEDON 1, EMBRYO DEFECTIVE 212 n=1 Tax=Hibiscus trionum TaxID=183268 RepID=A0A9W7HX34_HIBTR|nr:NUCLEAR FACTOR Y, SUBUNIT B9, LEAFY COTYLEDON 1, EMBRYO DEFECTIVE 212 [Hibiscus trionum]